MGLYFDVNSTPRDVYVSADYAYVANGIGLSILDISDPTNPTEVGLYELPWTNGVFLSGIYAYVVTTEVGLCIIDVSDPTDPTEVGCCDTYNCHGSVCVSGNYAYVGVQCVQNRQGLAIIDVSDPANPFDVAYYEITPHLWYWVEDCIVSGTYAYLGLWFPVKSADIIELLDGSDVSKMKQGYSDIPDISEILNGSNISKMKQGNLRMPDIFEILDVSDPLNPFQVGTCDLPSIAMGVDLAGSYAFVAGWEHGLQVVDIANPLNPYVVGSCNQTNDFLFGVYTLGDYAYAADYVGCFRAYDISDPLDPFEVGFLGGMSGPYAVHVVDNEPPQVSVISPNGGESLEPGATYDITWIAEDYGGIESISILYSVNAGQDWDTIATGEANDSTYEWIVPDTPSDSCLVKILAYDLSLNIGEDQSDSVFGIIDASGIEDEFPSLISSTLFQCNPNPFRDQIEIRFQITEGREQKSGNIDNESYISLRIFDISGREVKHFPISDLQSPIYTVVWNGRDDHDNLLPTGVYCCELKQGEFAESREILLLR